jgi:3-oxoadipate enol-lactonase
MPPGGRVWVPGRGRPWVWDSGGPPGAPTVVLLHGWMSTAALNWCRCVGPLAASMRVVAIDHRGHGRGIRSLRPFRLEDCADDVAALIGKLDVGPAVVAGYSMGGPLAQLSCARRRPDSLTRRYPTPPWGPRTSGSP